MLDRRKTVARLLADRGDLLVVTGLGSPTYDVHAAGDQDANYYLWGAMGGAALVGFGLALARPERRVLVITGEGEQLMALGSLATIAVQPVSNLDIVVLDNAHYGETGMQASHTGLGLDLGALAGAAGFADARSVTTEVELECLVADHSTRGDGPRLAVVGVRAENLERSMPSRDAVFVKNRFRSHLGLAPN